MRTKPLYHVQCPLDIQTTLRRQGRGRYVDDDDVDVDALRAGDSKEVTFLQSTSLAFGYSTDNKRATITEEQQRATYTYLMWKRARL